MIGYIKGDVEAIFPDSVILENNGIGYRIFTSSMAMSKMDGVHKSVKLFTYLHVREDEISLFGFPTTEELELFRLLLGVNGIGPKAALSILSVLSVKELQIAIMAGDAKAITKANGVGLKGANRVIMELKDKLKLDDLFIEEDSENTFSKDSSNGKTNAIQDTILALVSLGYSDSEAIKAIKQIPDAETMKSEDLLKFALKKMF